MGTPLIIAVAPNGARKTKADHPALPILPAEISEVAMQCADAGASMLHLHVRDEEEHHSLDPERYKQALTAIGETLGRRLICQITTEAVGRYTPAEQISCVHDVQPDAASVAMKEMVVEGSEDRAQSFYGQAAEAGIHIQHILYSGEELERFLALCETGIIPGRGHCVLFVLGRYSAGQVSAPDDLDPFLDVLARAPVGLITSWFVCAFGAREADCMTHAMEQGGHVRVGFENNLLLADGSQAPDNAALVSQIVDAAREIERPVASVDQARTILGIN